MDTRAQRTTGSMADTMQTGWQDRAGHRDRAADLYGASRAPSNERVRELLGWGLVAANRDRHLAHH